MRKKTVKMRKKNDTFLIKKGGIFAFFLFFCLFFYAKPFFFLIFNEKNNQNIENNSFVDGEALKYKISYGRSGKKTGALLAGHAYFNVKDSVSIENTPLHRINAQGQTTKIFSLFMKVRHSYQSIIKKHNLATIESKMEIVEGKYHNKNHTFFSTNQNQNCIITTSEQKNAVESENATSINNKINSNDILGAFYKLRAIEHKQILKSDTVFFSYYYNGEIFDSHFINLGEEIVKTKFGKIKTIKCAPLLEKGRIFKQKYGALVWVTADNMHLPVKLEIPILVGSIYVTLAKYENTIFDLKN